MLPKTVSEISLIVKFVKTIFPEVNRELSLWTRHAQTIDDENLRTQALASIRLKKFHALGGSIYALYPKADLQPALRFIVAFQTISDYLDNLCDRAGIEDEIAFRQLHLAMSDAVDPDQNFSDYYLFYPYRSDSQYLQNLVQVCREVVAGLPSYRLVFPVIKKYVALYSALQTFKHLKIEERESRLSLWAKSAGRDLPELFWWEFAAVTGSTLGIFVLLASAFDPALSAEDAQKLDSVYFPWISGLHILLDYYIDAEEDRQMGDLNFTAYYENGLQCRDRLEFFIAEALKSCPNLPYAGFHATVVKGLLAMYLSDKKALTPQTKRYSLSLVKSSGLSVRLYHHWCRLLRMGNIL